MSEQKTNTQNKILGWFIEHPWLKLISLILAILAWFYAAGELQNFNY